MNLPPGFPLPEAIANIGPEEPKGRLSEDETTFILRSTLLPEHHEDPNVLRFISKYMRCRSSAQAAREAGLDPKAGQALRTRPDIHQAITRLTEKSLVKYGFDASEVVERVKEIAALDPIEFENPDGSFKTKMSEIAPEARRAIKKFKAKNLFEKDPNGMPIQVGVMIEVELWDKMKGIELLGREKDLFKDTRKIEHDVSQNMKDFLLESKSLADKRFEQLIDVSPRAVIEGKVDE